MFVRMYLFIYLYVYKYMLSPAYERRSLEILYWFWNPTSTSRIIRMCVNYIKI